MLNRVGRTTREKKIHNMENDDEHKKMTIRKQQVYAESLAVSRSADPSIRLQRQVGPLWDEEMAR